MNDPRARTPNEAADIAALVARLSKLTFEDELVDFCTAVLNERTLPPALRRLVQRKAP